MAAFWNLTTKLQRILQIRRTYLLKIFFRKNLQNLQTRPPKVSPDCTSYGLSQPRRGQFLVQRPLLPAAAAAAQWSRRSYRCFSHSLIRPPCWRRVKAEKQFLSGANAAKNGPIHDDAPIWNTIEIFSNGNYLKEQVVFRKKKLDLFLVASLLWIQSTS